MLRTSHTANFHLTCGVLMQKFLRCADVVSSENWCCSLYTIQYNWHNSFFVWLGFSFFVSSQSCQESSLAPWPKLKTSHLLFIWQQHLARFGRICLCKVSRQHLLAICSLFPQTGCQDSDLLLELPLSTGVPKTVVLYKATTNVEMQLVLFQTSTL